MSEVGFEEFGRRFVEGVVTADRLRTSLEAMVAGSFETGVRMVAGLVQATGRGAVTHVRVDQVLGEDELAYRATLDAELAITVKVSGVPQRYVGKSRIELTIGARTRDDLVILVDVPDVARDDVELELEPLGRMASVIDQLGGVADQVRERIASFVNAQKEDDAARALRTIDVKPAIESEWQRRKPS